jgi:tetratricopeptide (TPR) repeat protein
VPLYREAIDVYESTLGPDHWMTSYARANLGACLTKLERWDEAESELLAAMSGLETTLGADNEHTERTLRRLLHLYAESGQREKAEGLRAPAD